MRDPASLFDLSADAAEIPLGLHLVAGLTGFADAGSAVTQVTDHILDTLPHRTIGEFDADELLDYRARRPVVQFDYDHISEYRPSRLRLDLVQDELDQPFLLLSGFEPDFQWERFTAAVLQIIDRFQVRDTTWVHAIPMPVPHTRPIGVTVSGNRRELIDSMSIWKPRTQAPGNALHLIEYRLRELGHPVTGFVLLVPHYLTDTEFPLAAVAGLESLSAATGLIFPTDSLREEGREFVGKIDGQVENNQELARLVGTLEERHDSYMQDNPVRSPLTDLDGALPTADEIAAELQNFLAARNGDDDAAQ